ncbi:MAG: hypothetical protein EXS13_10260 [Planctomycetes bacterium]|nr:hypothetical protein [Planctomycetota bacterium]
MSFATQVFAADLGDVRALVAAGELDTALEALASDPAPNNDAVLYRAFLERQRGCYDVSEQVLTHHLAAGGEPAPALLLRAETRWFAGNLEGAARDFVAAADAAAATGDARLSGRIETDRQVLREQRDELAEVSRAADSLAICWGLGTILLAVSLALTLALAARPRV